MIPEDDRAETDGTDLSSDPAKDDLAKDLPGETMEAKLDALHQRHFNGTALAGNTEHWNIVHAFKEDVKRLIRAR